MSELIIITDLDGSLLDSHSYKWCEAESWLAYFRKRAIPVVFCTSKTQAEVLQLQQQMQLEQMPYICENGAVLAIDQQIYLPSTIQHAKNYQQIVTLLEHLRSTHQFKFSGFADATLQQLMQWTGLDAQAATYAKMRQASEPIYWQDSPENLRKFRDCLQDHQLSMIQGGRFWHVMNQGSDKSCALAWLRQHYQKKQQQVLCIGLGDSPNDLLFLQQTEYSIVIRSAHSALMQFAADKQVYFTQSSATKGWVEGLEHVIPRINNNQKE